MQGNYLPDQNVSSANTYISIDISATDVMGAGKVEITGTILP